MQYQGEIIQRFHNPNVIVLLLSDDIKLLDGQDEFGTTRVILFVIFSFLHDARFLLSPNCN